ncbi:MAG: hypothetical protein AAFU83_04625, partial [Bacteroidota bacterium]
RVKKFAVTTIEGYRSAISSVQPRVGSDQTLSDVLKAFSQEAPAAAPRVVNWNLDVVLKFLRSSEFEPLDKASLRSLTIKTLFLLALASARRMGELQAISKDVGFRSGCVQLSYLLSFVAKNETRAHPIDRVFSIKGLAPLVSPRDRDILNCPVRALKEYVSRVLHLRDGHQHLFCSVSKPSRPISKNAISFFIRDLVRRAHEGVPSDCLPLFKVRAHDVRAVATSFAFLRNVPLQSIIDTVNWKTNSVFASHYLKDLAFQYGDCHSLGPIVVTNSVLT